MSNRLAPERLRNAITLVLWAIVLFPLAAGALAVGLAIAGAGIYVFKQGLTGNLTLPSLPSVPTEFEGLVLIGLIAVPAFLVWILTRYTYGSDFVDDSVESGAEAAETAAETADKVTDD
jgi:nitrate reductase NapE component